MKEEILEELLRLERKLNIKILYAVESGSRAWGFESKDSDWDVRFIYIHPLDWYLAIDEKKDSIEEMLPNDIDLSGWELRKALKLLRKSNPPLLEWLNSPLIYYEKYKTAQSLRVLSARYFSPKSCMHHYLNMAISNYKQYLQAERVKLKKYFYVLRPILACQWVDITNTMPPVEFQKLLNSQIKDKKLMKEIENLLLRKKQGEELKEELKIEVIHKYLDEKIEYYRQYAEHLNKNSNQPLTDELNELFRLALKEVYNS